ncbi:MAG: FAD-dependent oxidoreductase, partial [bacterium]|nr:FAD-dependent oxidoreductase [bacterium]
MYDVIIIGAGPAGCTAALYLARADYKVLCLYRSENDGALAWTNLIENYPGFESISGFELVQKFRNHAKKFGAEFKKGWVNAVNLEVEKKTVATVEGDLYESKALIIATGALERANKIPGEEEYLGKGVSYCATCDAAFFKNRPTVVVADSEASFEEAEFVSRFASKVYVLVPTRNPKAKPEFIEKLKENQKIELIFDAHPNKIIGDTKPRKIIYRSQNGFKELE